MIEKFYSSINYYCIHIIYDVWMFVKCDIIAFSSIESHLEVSKTYAQSLIEAPQTQNKMSQKRKGGYL